MYINDKQFKSRLQLQSLQQALYPEKGSKLGVLKYFICRKQA